MSIRRTPRRRRRTTSGRSERRPQRSARPRSRGVWRERASSAMLWIRLSYKEMEGMSTAVPPRPASVDANGENNDRHGLFVEAPLHGEHRVVMEPARDEQLLA